MYGYFILEHVRFLDALFATISFYLLNNSDTPPNIFIELARWAAPLMTASSVILIAATLRDRLANYLKYLRGGSIAVYGSNDESELILSELGSKGIRANDSFVLAERYILLGDEETNTAFCQAHRRELEGKRIYMKCRSMYARTSDANTKPFCDEETGARLYWKQADLFSEAAKQNYCLKLVFLGFGTLGQELLIRGLQNNLFHPNQKIEYHVFGDSAEIEEFQSIYHELDQIQDTICFHNEPWYRSLPLLEEADRLILCDSSPLDALLFALPGKEIDVLAAANDHIDFREEPERLHIFYWQKEAQKLSNILDEVLLERAKKINLRYAHLYGNVEENAVNLEKEWAKLDSFTRYSNISAADYHEVRLQMLNDWQTASGLTEPDTAYMELMAELEHIRWCNYHYLSNWKYGIPVNGKSKDKLHRIHQDLIPYNQLSESDKEKDRENIRILLEI